MTLDGPKSQATQLTAAITQVSSMARACRDRVWQRQLLDLAAACSAYAKIQRPGERERILTKATALASAAAQLGQDGSAAAASAVIEALSEEGVPPFPTGRPAAMVGSDAETGPLERPNGAGAGKVTEPLSPPPPAASASLVLIVDADPESRRVLETYLGAAGFRVRAFGDGGPALALIREEPPALVVTDLLLPMTPGEVLILALRRAAATAKIPILVVTSEPWRLGPEHQVDAVLTKPVNVTVVVDTAKRLLGAAAGTDPLRTGRF